MVEEVREGCIFEDVWCTWKEKVLAAAENEIGR